MKNKEFIKYIIMLIVILPIAGFLIYSSLKDINSNNNEIVEDNEQDIWALEASSNFKLSKVLSSGYPAIIDVGGSTCAACVKMKPALSELNQELQGHVIVNIVDVMTYYDLSKQFDTNLIPTQYFYNSDGTLYKKHVGGMTKEEILVVLEEMNIEI
ncbi:MAG: thioredoxin family protein [Anaeroplasmataceae bacterium]